MSYCLPFDQKPCPTPLSREIHQSLYGTLNTNNLVLRSEYWFKNVLLKYWQNDEDWKILNELSKICGPKTTTSSYFIQSTCQCIFTPFRQFKLARRLCSIINTLINKGRNGNVMTQKMYWAGLSWRLNIFETMRFEAAISFLTPWLAAISHLYFKILFYAGNYFSRPLLSFHLRAGADAFLKKKQFYNYNFNFLIFEVYLCFRYFCKCWICGKQLFLNDKWNKTKQIVISEQIIIYILTNLLLSIFSRLRKSNPLTRISLNLLSTLCASNFVFIVGVQASKNIFKCEMVAILLHYFHLSTSLWGFSHTYSIYDFVINNNAPKMKNQNFIAYIGSGIYVLVSIHILVRQPIKESFKFVFICVFFQFSFIISSSSYETFDYCWMSVQRGMIVNFMIPISALIVATTILGTLTLRDVASKQREVIVESIENILEKCHHLDSGVIPVASSVTIDKCCEDAEKVS